MGSLYFLPYLTKTHIIRKFKAAKKGKSNEKRKKQDYTFYHIVDLFGNIPNFIHKVFTRSQKILQRPIGIISRNPISIGNLHPTINKITYYLQYLHTTYCPNMEHNNTTLTFTLQAYSVIL